MEIVIVRIGVFEGFVVMGRVCFGVGIVGLGKVVFGGRYSGGEGVFGLRIAVYLCIFG